ncbi:MAG: O-methyltransferase [Firmicutes bacterium]|nr:O-methyltransferase [Bacillota bacterium]
MIEYDKDAIVAPYITRWLRENTPQTDERLARMERYAKDNGVPIAEPETARFLSVLCRIARPKRILEIGTAIGYSSVVMAKAAEDARILTIEYSADMADIARKNIELLGCSDRVEVVEADAKDYLSYIDEDESMDLIFLDGPKAHYIYMLDDCIRLLKKGGVLVSDNVLYKGMTADDAHVARRKITITERLRGYITALTNEKTLETSLLPLGDGVAVSVKTTE